MANNYIVVMDKTGSHLEHKQHKYLTREWKNGRWNYTYDAPRDHDTGNLWKEIADDRSSKANLYRLKANYAKASKNYTDASSRSASAKSKLVTDQNSKNFYNQLSKKYSNISKTWNGTYNGYNDLSNSYAKQAMLARDRRNQSEAYYARYRDQQKKKAIAEWENEPISKLLTAYHKGSDSAKKAMSKTIEEGGKLVKSLLSKWKKKVNETAINTAKKLGLKTQQVETRTDISTGQKWRRVNGGAWEKVK